MFQTVFSRDFSVIVSIMAAARSGSEIGLQVADLPLRWRDVYRQCQPTHRQIPWRAWVGEWGTDLHDKIICTGGKPSLAKVEEDEGRAALDDFKLATHRLEKSSGTEDRICDVVLAA